MSALGSFFARAMATLGGPQVATVIVVGGIAVGAIGGGVMASGVLGGGRSGASGQLAVYPCPNQGPALARVDGGQQLLVTGRLADGSWLRIHLPTPGRSEGWVQSTPLTVNGSIDTLPVVTCAPVAAVASPDVIPEESLTAIVNATPTPEPPASIPPSSGPTPTPKPSSTPTLASLATSTQTVSYDQGSYCPTAPKQVTISVRAAAAAGLSTVTLYWRAPSTPSYVPAAMTRTSGTSKSGTWSLTLDTTANRLTKAGPLSFYAIATDTAGATVRLPKRGTGAMSVAVCANTGPAITSVASSSGSSLSWNPLGASGSCQTASNITAVVKDSDGVKSVTLFYRRPGSLAWSSKPMNNQTIAGRWYANLDTLGDKISIPRPPTGALSFYIKAVDGKNASSQSSTRTLTIRRCDSKASYNDGVLIVAPPDYGCSTRATMKLYIYADDPDQPTNGLNVTFYWRLSTVVVGVPPSVISGHMSRNVAQGDRYQGTTSVFNGGTFKSGRLTTYAVITDEYGGTTRTGTFTFDTNCG